MSSGPFYKIIILLRYFHKNVFLGSRFLLKIKLKYLGQQESLENQNKVSNIFSNWCLRETLMLPCMRLLDKANSLGALSLSDEVLEELAMKHHMWVNFNQRWSPICSSSSLWDHWRSIGSKSIYVYTRSEINVVCCVGRVEIQMLVHCRYG